MRASTAASLVKAELAQSVLGWSCCHEVFVQLYVTIDEHVWKRVRASTAASPECARLAVLARWVCVWVWYALYLSSFSPPPLSLYLYLYLLHFSSLFRREVARGEGRNHFPFSRCSHVLMAGRHAVYHTCSFSIYRSIIHTGENCRNRSTMKQRTNTDGRSFFVVRRISYNTGVEDVFKVVRRLTTKGTENKKVGLQRLYQIAHHGARSAFPGIHQECIDAEMFADSMRLPRATVTAGTVARLSRGQFALGQAAFQVSLRGSPIPRPQTGYKTCAPAGHSKQVGIELLMANLIPKRRPGGQAFFENAILVRRCWAAGLVHTVAEQATNLQQPAVLVDANLGCAFLAVVVLGPCILGWPLYALEGREAALALVPRLPAAGLAPLFVADPYLATERVNHSFHPCWLPGFSEIPGALNTTLMLRGIGKRTMERKYCELLHRRARLVARERGLLGGA